MKKWGSSLRNNVVLVLSMLVCAVPGFAQLEDETNDALCGCVLDVLPEPESYADSTLNACRDLLGEYILPRIMSEDSATREEKKMVEVRKLIEICYNEAGIPIEDETQLDSPASRRIALKFGAILLVAILIPIAMSFAKRRQGKQNRLMQEAVNAIRKKPASEFPPRELVNSYTMKMPAGLVERVKSGRKELRIDLYNTALAYSMGSNTATLDFKDMMLIELEVVQNGKLMDLYLSLVFESTLAHVVAEDEQAGEQLIAWLSWLRIRKSSKPLHGEKGGNFITGFQKALQALGGTE